jgi:hypothetical protein
MPKPDKSALARDTQDWLVELRALRDKALARHDLAQAEELQAEIAEVGACLDGVLEEAAGAQYAPLATGTQSGRAYGKESG